MSSTSPFLTDSRKGLLVIYDYTASLCAVAVNIIVLRSVINAKIHLTGYKYALVSLGVSNLYLSCINIAIFVIEAARLYNVDNECWGQVFRSLQISGLIANLLNLLEMSVDHLIGIVFPFAYSRLTSEYILRRCFVLLWLMAILIGSAELPMTAFAYLFRRNSSSLGYDSATRAGILPVAVNGVNCTRDPLTANYNNTILMKILGILDMDNEEELLLSTFKDVASDGDLVSKPAGEDYFSSGDFSTSLRPNMDNMTTTDSICAINAVIDVLEQASGATFDNKKDCGPEMSSWCYHYRDVPFMEYTVVGLAIVSFILAAISYAMIFNEIFSQPKADRRNVRRLVFTTLLLIGTFAVCYLPFMMFELSMVVAIHVDPSPGSASRNSWHSFMVAHNVFSSLLISSPLIQPVLYAVRLSTVRRQILRDFPWKKSNIYRSSDAESCYWQRQTPRELSRVVSSPLQQQLQPV